MNKTNMLRSLQPGPGTRARVSALLLLLLAGCAFLRPAQSNTRFYVLTPDESGPGAAGSSTQHRLECLVRVRPVELAAYLRTKEIVIRTGPNELVFTRVHKWGEPLDEGIRRVLAEDLRRSGAIQAVLTDEAAPAGASLYTIELHLLACEGSQNQNQSSARFRALWRLYGPRGQAVEGEFQFKPTAWNGRDYGELAKGLSRGLDDLARALLEELAHLAADHSGGG